MALRFASAAAAGLPASVSMSARMAHVFHGARAWPNCALAFDRAQDFLPRFVEAAESAKRLRRDCSCSRLPSPRRGSQHTCPPLAGRRPRLPRAVEERIQVPS